MIGWKLISLPTISLILGFNLAAQDQVRVYPAAAGEPLSKDFTVTADNSNVPVYLAKVTTTDSIEEMKTKGPDEASFASFDMQAGVAVSVTCPGAITSAKILPSSSGITPVLAGNEVTFTVSKPGQLTLEVNGDWVHSLHLFANPYETDVPRIGDPGLIYFGPGIHETNGIKVTSGQTLYIDEGAVIYGTANPNEGGAVISLAGDNITLRGNGIVDGSRCPFHSKDLLFVHGTNIRIEGVTLRDSSTWTVPIRRCDQVKVKNIKIFGYRGNSDGIDICNSTNVDVSDCFLRTFDDLVVLKTDKGQGEERNITVENCVLWNELAHALSIGAELRENVEHVRFSDCDVIHDKGREWVLRVYHCDSAHIRDVTFDNIRVEESRRLISLWIGKAVWSIENERGHIDDIAFKNISAEGPDPSVDLTGFDADHAIHGVQFDSVVVNGQALRSTDVKQNQFVRDVSVTP